MKTAQPCTCARPARRHVRQLSKISSSRVQAEYARTWTQLSPAHALVDLTTESHGTALHSTCYTSANFTCLVVPCQLCVSSWSSSSHTSCQHMVQLSFLLGPVPPDRWPCQRIYLVSRLTEQAHGTAQPCTCARPARGHVYQAEYARTWTQLSAVHACPGVSRDVRSSTHQHMGFAVSCVSIPAREA